MMKYTHTNINTSDWEKLAQFYIDVFECEIVPPYRHLHGEWFEKASGVPGAEVYGVHIALPGYDQNGPTLELFTHTVKGGDSATEWNEKGFAHIAIHVDNVQTTYDKLLEHGGSSNGKIVKNYYASMDKTLTMIYANDPEGNCIEIQNWTDGRHNS